MGEMFLQNISNKTAQQLMCTCTIAVGRLSFKEEYKKQKYYFFAKFFRNNLLSSKLCITFAPANKQWFARMAG